MSRIGSLSSRTTQQLMTMQLLNSLRRTQADMLKAQEEISTGKAVSKPSDAPAKTAAILVLERALAAREQTDRNLEHAGGLLNTTDQALGEVHDQLVEAASIASSQVGIGSSAETRANQAAVIDAKIKALLETANRSFQQIPLFGGTGSAGGGPVFTEFLGGVRYNGTRADLTTLVGGDESVAFNTNGDDAFAALSARVKSAVALNPGATAATRIMDVNGAQGVPVRRGVVVLTVDSTQVSVDLNDAETLGDVADRVNDAINGVSSGAGNLALSGAGFALTAGAGHTISIAEVAAGQVAGDLGIRLTANGATVAGAGVSPKVTPLTTLASLGITADLNSGLTITQGNTTKSISFAGAATIQDLQNKIEQANLGLRLEINDDATGLNLISEVSGVELSVSENGGTTATDLGLRTFHASTKLADFRHGLGVDNEVGKPDFRVRLHDGRSFDVDIDGVTDVAGVVAAIKSAAAGAGISVGDPGQAGTEFNIGLATSGNGFRFEDGTTGTADFRVDPLGLSLAADNLGINTNAGAAASFTGKDNAKVRVEGVFTHMLALRDALQKNDSFGITLAGGGLQTDAEAVNRTRADVGVRAQRVDQQKNRSADQKLSETALLSTLRDADLTEVITRFTQLQQQLQASLQVGSKIQQLSFLDYLR